MNVDDIRGLYRYNDWANERLMGVVAGISAEAFTRDNGGSHRSIRDVLAHIASADWVWLERWKGGSPSALPPWYESPEREVLAAELSRFAAERSEFLAGLTEADLARELTFRYLAGRPGSVALRDALFHVANHSTYHRGQLASMLRLVGSPAPSTDFTTYRAERRGA